MYSVIPYVISKLKWTSSDVYALVSTHLPLSEFDVQ